MYASFTTVASGNSDVIYYLDVPGDDSETTPAIEGGVDGDTVIFHIAGYVASQTGTWSLGSNVHLDLMLPEEPCYVLTLTHTGNGSNPVASPTNSEDCPIWTISSRGRLSISEAQCRTRTGLSADGQAPPMIPPMAIPILSSCHLTTIQLGLFIPRLPGITG